jgi:molybdate/tungstate transport system permease protein
MREEGLRRFDLIAIVALLVLAHGLVISQLLDRYMTAVLLVTNLYALYHLRLAWRRSMRAAAGFVAGYAILVAVFLVYNPQWQPLFFIYAIVYASVFRLPLVLGLFWIFVAAHTLLQPFALEAFAAAGFAYAATYQVYRGGQGWFVVACLGVGLGALAALMFPLLAMALQDTPRTLIEAFHRPEVRTAIGYSVWSATLSTLVTAGFGVPLAYGLARSSFRGRHLVEGLIDLPILIPHSAVGLALLNVLGAGVIGTWSPSGKLLGVVIAQVFVSCPFLIKTAIASFEAVDPRLELVARTLGASPASAFVRVTLPLAARGLAIGAILCWSRAISEIGSLQIFSEYPKTAPILVYQDWASAGLEYSRPVAVLLVLTCLWMFVGFHLVRRLALGAARSGGQVTRGAS